MRNVPGDPKGALEELEYRTRLRFAANSIAAKSAKDLQREKQGKGIALVNEQRANPHWLIVKYETSRLDMLTTNLAGGEEALPVFSFEEEARTFLEYGALEGRWRIRETTAGELISVLFGPCAFTERIVLDPLPKMDVGVLSHLVSMPREDFVEFLMNKQKLWLSNKRSRQ